jgi:hypothetical protein
LTSIGHQLKPEFWLCNPVLLLIAEVFIVPVILLDYGEIQIIPSADSNISEKYKA